MEANYIIFLTFICLFFLLIIYVMQQRIKWLNRENEEWRDVCIAIKLDRSEKINEIVNLKKELELLSNRKANI